MRSAHIAEERLNNASYSMSEMRGSMPRSLSISRRGKFDLLFAFRDVWEKPLLDLPRFPSEVMKCILESTLAT